VAPIILQKSRSVRPGSESKAIFKEWEGGNHTRGHSETAEKGIFPKLKKGITQAL